jgi:hypothetical protein
MGSSQSPRKLYGRSRPTHSHCHLSGPFSAHEKLTYSWERRYVHSLPNNSEKPTRKKQKTTENPQRDASMLTSKAKLQRRLEKIHTTRSPPPDRHQPMRPPDPLRCISLCFKENRKKTTKENYSTRDRPARASIPRPLHSLVPRLCSACSLQRVHFNFFPKPFNPTRFAPCFHLIPTSEATRKSQNFCRASLVPTLLLHRDAACSVP